MTRFSTVERSSNMGGLRSPYPKRHHLWIVYEISMRIAQCSHHNCHKCCSFCKTKSHKHLWLGPKLSQHQNKLLIQLADYLETPRSSLTLAFCIIRVQIKIINITWFWSQNPMPSCIALIHWTMKTTQPGSRCTQNSSLQPLYQLLYQLCFINKVYFSMLIKLVIPAISYPIQISQTAIHKLAIHTAQNDVISAYCNVLCVIPLGNVIFL